MEILVSREDKEGKEGHTAKIETAGHGGRSERDVGSGQCWDKDKGGASVVRARDGSQVATMPHEAGRHTR